MPQGQWYPSQRAPRTLLQPQSQGRFAVSVTVPADVKPGTYPLHAGRPKGRDGSPEGLSPCALFGGTVHYSIEGGGKAATGSPSSPEANALGDRRGPPLAVPTGDAAPRGEKLPPPVTPRQYWGARGNCRATGGTRNTESSYHTDGGGRPAPPQPALRQRRSYAQELPPLHPCG